MLYFMSEIKPWIIQYKQTVLCLSLQPTAILCYTSRITPLYALFQSCAVRLADRLGFNCACWSRWLSITKYQHEVVARHYLQTSFTLALEHRLMVWWFDYKSDQFCPSRRNLFHTQWSIILSIRFFVTSGKSYKNIRWSVWQFSIFRSVKIASKHTVCQLFARRFYILFKTTSWSKL